MNEQSLLKEVESTFSNVEMPPQNELAFDAPRYIESEEIRQDMEEFRGKEITGKEIRNFHRYLPVLSAKATRWIMPYFLRFCLSEEARKYSRNETASLIYALSPQKEFRMATAQRFELLNSEQITCLIDFLGWCLDDDYWTESSSERIRSGREFLSTLRAARG